MGTNDFIQFSNAGLSIASYADIRKTLIEKYKGVYGNDIDLSTGTADGVFVAEIAEMMLKICETVKLAWNNLNAETASGVYLDALCKLSNVRRQPATSSVATITVENGSGSDDITFDSTSRFLDQSGKEWMMVESTPVTIATAGSATILVKCVETGAIQAPAGWINGTASASGVTITQTLPATIGSNVESDASLRARRASSEGASGSTTLGSLTGSLMNLSGIQDVKIYNNATTNAITAKDTTSVPAHSIYVILRQDPASVLTDATIGTTIYNKSTPGIPTTQSGKSAERKSYTVASVNGFSANNQVVHWRKCVPVHPTISITLTNISDGFTTELAGELGRKLMNWLNALTIGTNLFQSDVLLQCRMNTNPIRGLYPFTISPDISINSSTTSGYSNTDSYYNYTTVTVKKNTSTSSTTYSLVLQ